MTRRRASSILCIAAVHVGTMLASALVLCAAVEAFSYAGMWLEGRRNG